MAFVDDLPETLRARTPAEARARAALAAWAADHHGHRTAPVDLIAELGPRLTSAGIAVYRITCSLRDYHPEYVGRQYTWHRLRGVEQIDRRFTPNISETYTLSPMKIIHDGAAAVRRHLMGPQALRDFPVLDELAADGVTDYLGLPLLFSDGSRQFIAFATDRPEGFEPDELAFLELLMPQLCLRIEIEHARQLADQLLQVYLGTYAAPRVISGEIRRVRGDSIQAIILAVDMRGFTRLTDTLGPDAVFATLSVYYDAVSEPVLKAGGDVVKMIADGILAVFPLPPDASAEEKAATAWRAAAAVKEALDSLEGLSPEDLPEGVWPIKAGFALHAGQVTFGNVGSRARLDFTLIGPSVNEAFRMEAKTKSIGQPLLLSEAFAALVGREGLISLGFHELAGVREPKEIFVLAPEA